VAAFQFPAGHFPNPKKKHRNTLKKRPGKLHPKMASHASNPFQLPAFAIDNYNICCCVLYLTYFFPTFSLCSFFVITEIIIIVSVIRRRTHLVGCFRNGAVSSGEGAAFVIMPNYFTVMPCYRPRGRNLRGLNQARRWTALAWITGMIPLRLTDKDTDGRTDERTDRIGA